MNKEVMSPKEAAKYVGISTVTFYKLLKKGQVPARKFGRQWRIKKDILDRFLGGQLAGKI